VGITVDAQHVGIAALPLPTAADHEAADLLAQKLAGRTDVVAP
jgi:hypothetical protein